MKYCQYRHNQGSATGTPCASCTLVDEAAGFSTQFSTTICERCEASGVEPLPPLDPRAGGQWTRWLLQNTLCAPVCCRGSDALLKTTYGTTRTEAVKRSIEVGRLFSVADGVVLGRMRIALQQAVAGGLPPAEAEAIAKEHGVPWSSKPPPRQKKTGAQAAGNASVSASPRANLPIFKGLTPVQHFVALFRWHREHPCVSLGEQTGRQCSTGPIYKCAIHGTAAYCHLQSVKPKSCVSCKDYVELIPPREPSSLNLPILVTTCPLIRRGKVAGHRDTLPATLQSILDAGWTKEDVTIFAEPESHVPDGWRTVWREVRLGPRSNLLEGMRQLWKENPEADGILCVEDDTVLARGARAELNRRGIPDDVGLIRVFRMEGRGRGRSSDSAVEHKRSDGYQYVKPKLLLWGSNAVIVTRRAAERIMTDPELPVDHETSPDFWLGFLMHRYGLREICCNPSLAQTDVTKPSTVRDRKFLLKRLSSDTFVADVSRQLSTAINPATMTPPTPTGASRTVFLISFNRLDWLRKLAAACERFDGADIHIVDNASTWPPLIEWLKTTCPYTVHHAGANLGKRVVWELGLDAKATEQYVVSDPDLSLITIDHDDAVRVPVDALDRLGDGLRAYPWAASAGLGLEIDDLPDSFPLKRQVLHKERKFWLNRLPNGFFRALVDTTFAMYRRGDVPSYGNRPAIRSDRPYVARHRPWYIGLNELTDEDRHYYQAGSTWGSGSISRILAPMVQASA